MATIENRSRYTVSVKNRADLYREFPFTKLKQAKQYVADLGKHLRLELSQQENRFLVRIIQQGFVPVRYTCRSLQQAEHEIARMEAERHTGLFLDYTKAHKTTFEARLRRYIKEEGPKNKGWEKSEKYKCLGWLEDLDGGPAKKGIVKKGRSAPKVDSAIPMHHAMRKTVTAIQWMRKPFANIQTMDIEEYMKDRGQYVSPATIDRELDIIRAIFSVARKVWKYRLGETQVNFEKRYFERLASV